MEEIEMILATTKEPYQRYQDVAKRFHVSESLVFRLVKEQKKQPEKLAALLCRTEANEEKCDAIKDVATEILASNKAIVSAKQVQEAVHEQKGKLVDLLLVR